MVRYQLLSDYLRSMSIFYEKSPGLFSETVDVSYVQRAAQQLSDTVETIIPFTRG
jgi:hypothetical protein